MRKHQINIKINSFGNLPKKLEEEGAKNHEITVYADGNNIYEALAAAYYEALTVVGKHYGLPSFGTRSNSEMTDNRRKKIMEEMERHEMKAKNESTEGE